MEIRCPACNKTMEYDARDGSAVCRTSSCPYGGSWVFKEYLANFTVEESAFDQFRASLAQEKQKYDDLLALVTNWSVNAKKMAHDDVGYKEYAKACKSLHDVAGNWQSIVCDEVDRTVTPYNGGPIIGKLDRIKAVRILAHLFPGGVAGDKLGLAEAKKFIEDHYDEDGSRK